MRARWLGSLVGSLCLVAPALAQDVAGVWVAKDEGGEVRLTLQVDAGGGVTGSLDGPGASMRVQGRLANGVAECTAAQGEASLSFRARVDAVGLPVDLLEPGSGQVMEQLRFARSGGAPAPAPVPPPSPGPPAAGGFAGTFAGDGLVVELRPAGPERWEGRIELQGQAMPCRAGPAGPGRIAGTFDASGSAYEFEAALAGDALTLASGGRTYRLARRASGPGPGPGPAPGGDKVTHPAGVELELPRGWKAVQRERGVQLVPPGLQADDPAAAEVHLLVAETVKDPAIQSPDHPGVAEYMDQFLASLFPALKRTAPPALEPGPGGKLATLTWAGPGPDGSPLEARAQVAVVGGVGVALVSAAAPELLARRVGELRTSVGTLRRGAQAAAPPQGGAGGGELAGRWVLNSSWRGGQNRFSGDAQTVVALRPDGSASYSRLSYVSTPNGVVENKEEKAGRWSAAGGVLTLQWQDGETERSRYSLSGAELTCEGEDGTRTVWRR